MRLNKIPIYDELLFLFRGNMRKLSGLMIIAVYSQASNKTDIKSRLV